MAITWILIANASEAFLYETQKAKLFNSNSHPKDDLLILIKHYEHMASRKHTRDLVTDREGRYIASQTAGHGAFVEKTDAKEVEENRFAHELAQVLERGRTSGDFDELIIIATPRFHGYINNHLNSHLNKLLTCRLEKDYTHLNHRKLIEQLREHI
jgi:protein required for attachment to host cells